MQRPDTGLLANLFEFLSVPLTDLSSNPTMTKTLVSELLETHFNLKISMKEVSKSNS